ncbi:hypothetical protein BD324DRAFT_233497 [Kockovaella imperatae]|uniref:Uncharacterized protein n=1 Tax=Kockovaella imperatae TaxID=4999 RepID=A0A1Y1UNZ2_9TREE|nr:hypothetical protein BD324DRAFT_233497 [Kockovaella imperatae]ORX39770.1 hypothetical protein BD324DRAFT_233497 [Kockovaella imperatae]
MAQSIPTKEQSVSAATSQINTPNATPPTSGPYLPWTAFTEGRLQQLLAHFDSGTHEFDRADRETPFEKRMSWSEDFPNTPSQHQSQSSSSRRPSFLSSLSLTRFGAVPQPSSNPASGNNTPAHTPVTSTHPNLPSSLQMTNTVAPSSSSPSPTADPIQRPHSTPNMSSSTAPTDSVIESLKRTSPVASAPGDQHAPAPAPTMMMQRSNTLPGNKTQGALGFSFLQRKASIGQGLGAKPLMAGLETIDLNQEPQRHFDPSKEPRLHGLL